MGNRPSHQAHHTGCPDEEIGVQALYNLQADLRAFFLILDLRSSKAFELTHIDSSRHAATVSEALALVRAPARVAYAQVILVSSSEHMQTTSSRAVHAGLAAEWPALRVRSLSGGFGAYQQVYGFMCTGHKYFVAGRLLPSVIEYTEACPSGRVFLSNFGVASSPGALGLCGITHVVNCTLDCPFPEIVSASPSRNGQNEAFVRCWSKLAAAREEADEVAILLAEEALSEQLMAADKVTPSRIEVLRVPVVDEADEDIAAHFDAAVAFVDRALASGGRVLLHCKHGQSRSPTVLAAWLVASRGFDVDAALCHLKACRPMVCPNRGFVAQLRKRYELSTGMT